MGASCLPETLGDGRTRTLKSAHLRGQGAGYLHTNPDRQEQGCSWGWLTPGPSGLWGQRGLSWLLDKCPSSTALRPWEWGWQRTQSLGVQLSHRHHVYRSPHSLQRYPLKCAAPVSKFASPPPHSPPWHQGWWKAAWAQDRSQLMKLCMTHS